LLTFGGGDDRRRAGNGDEVWAKLGIGVGICSEAPMMVMAPAGAMDFVETLGVVGLAWVVVFRRGGNDR
jgi:hypothetical protein